jgi:hypothetical protein
MNLEGEAVDIDRTRTCNAAPGHYEGTIFVRTAIYVESTNAFAASWMPHVRLIREYIAEYFGPKKPRRNHAGLMLRLIELIRVVLHAKCGRAVNLLLS